LQRLPHAAAGHELAVQQERLDDQAARLAFRAQTAQEGRVSLAPASEAEVWAFDEAACLQSVAQDALEEILGRELEQGTFGAQHDNVIDPSRVQQHRAVLQGGEDGLEVLGRKKFEGMRVERDGDRRPAEFIREAPQLAAQRLMSAMHPIEVADAHRAAPAGGWYRFMPMKSMNRHQINENFNEVGW
jgi:hypothetical protein